MNAPMAIGVIVGVVITLLTAMFLITLENKSNERRIFKQLQLRSASYGYNSRVGEIMIRLYVEDRYQNSQYVLVASRDALLTLAPYEQRRCVDRWLRATHPEKILASFDVYDPPPTFTNSDILPEQHDMSIRVIVSPTLEEATKVSTALGNKVTVEDITTVLETFALDDESAVENKLATAIAKNTNTWRKIANESRHDNDRVFWIPGSIIDEQLILQRKGIPVNATYMTTSYAAKLDAVDEAQLAGIPDEDKGKYAAYLTLRDKHNQSMQVTLIDLSTERRFRSYAAKSNLHLGT